MRRVHPPDPREEKASSASEVQQREEKDKMTWVSPGESWKALKEGSIVSCFLMRKTTLVSM